MSPEFQEPRWPRVLAANVMEQVERLVDHLIRGTQCWEAGLSPCSILRSLQPLIVCGPEVTLDTAVHSHGISIPFTADNIASHEFTALRSRGIQYIAPR